MAKRLASSLVSEIKATFAFVVLTSLIRPIIPAPDNTGIPFFKPVFVPLLITNCDCQVVGERLIVTAETVL